MRTAYSIISYAQAYLDAAIALGERQMEIEAKGFDPDARHGFVETKSGQWPVVFLMRHSVEVCLKAVLLAWRYRNAALDETPVLESPAEEKHNIEALLQKVKEHYDCPEELERFAKAMHAVDPSSMEFRYAYDKRTLAPTVSQESSVKVDALLQLAKANAIVFGGIIESIVEGVEDEATYRREIAAEMEAEYRSEMESEMRSWGY